MAGLPNGLGSILVWWNVDDFSFGVVGVRVKHFVTLRCHDRLSAFMALRRYYGYTRTQ